MYSYFVSCTTYMISHICETSNGEEAIVEWQYEQVTVIRNSWFSCITKKKKKIKRILKRKKSKFI